MPQLLLPHLLLYVHGLAVQALDGTALARVLAEQGGKITALAGVLAQSKITVNPRPTMPGSNLPQIILDGVAYFGIAASLGGLLLGGACWGLGSATSNYGRADFGKRCTLYSAIGALIIGAASALINFAVGLGGAASPGTIP